MWKIIIDMINSVNAGKEAGISNPFQALTTLGSARTTLITQATLHTQLALVEWEEEKQRLTKMLVLMLMAFGCFLCLLISIGVFALTLSWETQARIPVSLSIIGFYTLALIWTGRRISRLAAQASHSFAATRAEIAADIALIKTLL